MAKIWKITIGIASLLTRKNELVIRIRIRPLSVDAKVERKKEDLRELFAHSGMNVTERYIHNYDRTKVLTF